MKERHLLVPLLAALLMTGLAYGNGPGDMNCDGIVDFDDIDPFVAALGCADGDPNCWPGPCPWINGDTNDDGDVTFDDIDPFVALIGTTYPQGEIMPAELAGNALGQYPHFEYVKAFNENATIELALDPTRYPDIVDVTADVYVVEAKSAGGWDADPTLIDLTTDGALTVTFGGTTIQENTFTVVGPLELDSAVFQDLTGDFTGVGHGYDMVVDMNQNGVLDAGDYIDGYGRQAGLYVVHDLTLGGPLAVTETLYSGGAWLQQDLYYPTDIADMGELPVIIVSHGNGHNYQWYDHIGFHMASYGYIVMSHSNQTGPGIETASTTTLTNTDYLLGNLGTIAGGALQGHVDTSRIMWIGHSRGGEGITRAYDRLFDGVYTPDHYTIEDIILLSSMAPTDFLGTNNADPHGVNYHLWTAAADSDVSGTPSNDIAQTFHLHDRATGFRHSTVLHGVGHGDLHDGGGSSVASGPCLIGRPRTHLIQKGFFLPMIKYYFEGNVPGQDFLWRQWEQFKPIGAPTLFCAVTGDDAVVVNNTYRNMADEGNFFVDDYQTETSTLVSSSGGAVSYTAANLFENRLDDGDTSFTWTTADPMNGMTYGRSTDTTRGVVFDWNGVDRYIEWEIIPDFRNFENYLYLSFRACQGTRHPFTTAVLEDLTFTVTLRDANDVTSSINIGAYGGGLEDPYQRTGAGSGTGWHNDFEAIRIRLTDFLNNGSGLDLSDIVAIRFNFGPSWGSNEGRVGVDEIQLTSDFAPFFTPLTINVPGGVPEFIPAGEPTNINVEIFPGDDTLVADSAKLYYRYDDGEFLAVPLTPTAAELWTATLPSPACGDRPEYYFAATGAVTGTVFAPNAGETAPYVSFVGTFISILEDDFETDLGWTFEDDPTLTSGGWERTEPTSDGSYGEPTEDFDGSGACLLTEDGNTRDVDRGPTWATSPALDLSGTTNPVLRYARWMACDDAGTAAEDFLYVELSDDDGATWATVEVVADNPMWVPVELYIADFVDLTSQVRLRFWTDDTPNNSKTEAAVDAVQIFDVSCP